MLGDLMGGVRSVFRRPGHSVLVVTVLGVGMAAGIGVATYARGFFQPLPGADARGLVRLFDARAEAPWTPFSYLDYLDYLDYLEGSEPAFAGLGAATAGYAASIRHETTTEVALIEAVSGNLFDVLDVPMAAGRRLAASDDVPGAEHVAVISWAWWQRQWDGDPGVVGSVVQFNFRPHVVVGVAAPEFRGSLASGRPDAWLPFTALRARYTSWDQAALDRDRPLVRVYGRLRPEATRARALATLAALAGGLDEVHPRESADARRPTLLPATWIAPQARAAEAATTRAMLAAAALLLVLVSANVGNLLLALAAERRRETALRAALGASRGRLVRAVLAESAVLAVAGGASGLLLAGIVGERLGSYFARPSVWGMNVARDVHVDGTVVLVALGLTAAVSVAIGLLPAWGAARGDLVDALKTGGAGGGGRPRRLLGVRGPTPRDALLSAQVALAVVLLVLSGLVVRTLGTVGAIDPGFAWERTVASYVSTSSTGVQEAERDRWFREMAATLTAEPWVRVATLAGQAPLSPHGTMEVRVDGAEEPVEAIFARAVPGYFEALDIGVEEGRGIELRDSLGAPAVAVVSRTLVERHLGGGAAVGRTVWLPDGEGGERALEIVGIAADTRTRDLLAEPEAVVYTSMPQQGYNSGSALVVVMNGDPGPAVPRLERWLRDYEEHIAIVNILPYADVVRGFTYAQRMNAELFSALGAIGLVLACLGIYGVTSLAVRRRTREIGIRKAVGAGRLRVVGAVLGRVGFAVAIGVGGGVAVALLGGRMVDALLVGVRPADPVALVLGAALPVVAALGATLAPARRAAGTDPAESLRAD